MNKRITAIHLDNGVIQLSGELSFNTVNDVLPQGKRWLADSAGVDIDLKGITRADSAGLALLVAWMRDAEQMKKNIRFLNIPDQMRAIATVCGLNGLLPTGQ